MEHLPGYIISNKGNIPADSNLQGSRFIPNCAQFSAFVVSYCPVSDRNITLHTVTNF
jgi:hypothetical protein